MSADKSLKILDAIYDMALRKVEANKQRENGENMLKYNVLDWEQGYWLTFHRG